MRGFYKDFKDNELLNGMRQNLIKGASKSPNLIKAAECLHSAIEIFEEIGLQSKADDILNILSKIAIRDKQKNLTSNKMVENLKDHGTVFNLDGSDFYEADMELADDDSLMVFDKEIPFEDFEEEKD